MGAKGVKTKADVKLRADSVTKINYLWNDLLLLERKIIS